MMHHFYISINPNFQCWFFQQKKRISTLSTVLSYGIDPSCHLLARRIIKAQGMICSLGWQPIHSIVTYILRTSKATTQMMTGKVQHCNVTVMNNWLDGWSASSTNLKTPTIHVLYNRSKRGDASTCRNLCTNRVLVSCSGKNLPCSTASRAGREYRPKKKGKTKQPATNRRCLGTTANLVRKAAFQWKIAVGQHLISKLL